MSWYDKDLVTCHKCGKRFSTPIEKFEHKRNGGCHVTRTTYPNGSIWVQHDRVPDVGYVKAKNPFGKFWIMQFKTGIHNQATGGASGCAGIFRRGRKWHLRKDEDGYVWV